MRLLETSNDHSTSQTSRRTQCPPQKNALSDITAIHFWPNIYDWFLQRIPHLILILLQALLKTRYTRIQKSCLTNLHLNTHKYRHMYMPIYIYTYMCICVYIYIYYLSLSLYVLHTLYCLCRCAPSMQWLNISTPTAFARCAWHLRSQHGALQALLTSLLHLGGDRGCIPLSEWVMGYTQI